MILKMNVRQPGEGKNAGWSKVKVQFVPLSLSHRGQACVI